MISGKSNGLTAIWNPANNLYLSEVRMPVDACIDLFNYNLLQMFLIIALVGGVFILIYTLGGGKLIFRLSYPFMLDDEDAYTHKELDNELINYYHKVLKKFVPYYSLLDKPGRKKFINRLHDLIHAMELKGEENQAINLKVCTICCAPAIQITFGLERYLFNSFHTIVVYPKMFYSDSIGRFVKGGVSRGDAIFFSFDDLLKGYANPEDGLNLGLHEMAHAIHMESFDDDFQHRYPVWEKTAFEELEKMRHQADPVLRNYAGQNRHELFAVCVETFFEKSAEMKSKSPVLYQATCELLNQDPLRLSSTISY